MEIIYQDESIFGGISGSRLTVQFNGKPYKVRWGRSPQFDPGNLPYVISYPDILINDGLFQSLEHTKVPILADSFSEEIGPMDVYRCTIKPGEYISGLLVKHGREKRVYVITRHYPEGGYFLPKVLRFD